MDPDLSSAALVLYKAGVNDVFFLLYYTNLAKVCNSCRATKQLNEPVSMVANLMCFGA